MHFIIKKESDVDATWHFFVFYGSLSTIEAIYNKLIC